MKRERILGAGRDLRQACLARLLAEDGHRVHASRPERQRGHAGKPDPGRLAGRDRPGRLRGPPSPVAGAEGDGQHPPYPLCPSWPLCWMPSPPDPVRVAG